MILFELFHPIAYQNRTKPYNQLFIWYLNSYKNHHPINLFWGTHPFMQTDDRHLNWGKFHSLKWVFRWPWQQHFIAQIDQVGRRNYGGIGYLAWRGLWSKKTLSFPNSWLYEWTEIGVDKALKIRSSVRVKLSRPRKRRHYWT